MRPLPAVGGRAGGAAGKKSAGRVPAAADPVCRKRGLRRLRRSRPGTTRRGVLPRWDMPVGRGPSRPSVNIGNVTVSYGERLSSAQGRKQANQNASVP
ncbi:hypothetical protein Sm713_22460 [Streptomyces sp. TS71-3]|nr:hypothetical protein Sm713_22460 [Streptomyces sp. TS71-3]